MGKNPNAKHLYFFLVICMQYLNEMDEFLTSFSRHPYVSSEIIASHVQAYSAEGKCIRNQLQQFRVLPSSRHLLWALCRIFMPKAKLLTAWKESHQCSLTGQYKPGQYKPGSFNTQLQSETCWGLAKQWDNWCGISSNQQWHL